MPTPGPRDHRGLSASGSGRAACGPARLGFINEHRQVTVLFVRFDGFDYDDDPAGERAGSRHYFAAVVRVVQRYDGYLNKVDMGDKGSKYIVLFGAPVAHEDDEERALRCALELTQSGTEEPPHIGVNTGFVFCGQVGSAARQEYTVMGDPVNLAARLMQAARPARSWSAPTPSRRLAEAFSWARRCIAIQVKGKSRAGPGVTS